MLLGNLVEKLFGLAPVTFKSNQNRDFIPDMLEHLTVIGKNLIEDLAIRNVNDPSRALIGVDPVAELHQAEHQDALVEDIVSMVADLDAVSDLEGLSPDEIKNSMV